MKKTFPLCEPGKDNARVLDAIKHDVRKYVKRERKKIIPEGFDTWRFDCKVGADQSGAANCDLQEISAAIDVVAKTGGPEVYVEIVAAPGYFFLSAQVFRAASILSTCRRGSRLM